MRIFEDLLSIHLLLLTESEGKGVGLGEGVSVYRTEYVPMTGVIRSGLCNSNKVSVCTAGYVLAMD